MDFEIHQFNEASSMIYLLEFGDEFIPENYFNTLSEIELEKYFSFNNPKRQKEYVATRILKHELFGYQEIKYKAHGAPYFDEHDYISISHAQNMVGIATNPEFQIGFDIELIHDKILHLYHKFLNEEERICIDLNDPTALITCWSMKETLYKLAGRKEIHFKEELLLDFGAGESVKGKIINPEQELLVDLYAFQFKNFILSINKKAVKYVEKHPAH